MRLILIIGVSGCGKTTIGKALAAKLGCPFLDADEFHPEANIRKMAGGIPLRDEDRWPWLQNCVAAVREHQTDPSRSVVLACSALKEAYRDIFKKAFPERVLVYLKGSPSRIEQRMRQRKGHFMKEPMLRSQFADLEEPEDAVVIPVELPVEAVLGRILEAL